MTLKIFEIQASILKAMANTKRLEILSLLALRELNVGQLQEMLSLPQANLSQHLSVLRRNKIVKFRRTGKEMVYSLYSNDVKSGLMSFRKMATTLVDDENLALMIKAGLSIDVPVVADPVCKMRMTKDEVLFSTIYKGKGYFFCASGCQSKFINYPEMYI